MKNYTLPLLLWFLFEAVAVLLWLTLDNLFYLFNFSYIGTCLAVGMAFYLKRAKQSRTVVQFAVGLYMLIYLGLWSNENMQLEGFWYYLFSGVFEAAVIHYVVAKLAGPLVFGRGWYGYACWTAMLLERLPYPTPRQPRKRIGFIRYIVFSASLLFVGALFVFQVPGVKQIMFRSFIAGNVLYYAVGFGLAFALKDNHAFCKYVCPVTVFLKPASYYAWLRVKNDTDKCIGCGKCNKVCPMEVDMRDNSRKRLNGTECILCLRCVEACPAKSLHL